MPLPGKNSTQTHGVWIGPTWLKVGPTGWTLGPYKIG